jgi:hypothetical protein
MFSLPNQGNEILIKKKARKISNYEAKHPKKGSVEYWWNVINGKYF